jgi:hypothetical protein
VSGQLRVETLQGDLLAAADGSLRDAAVREQLVAKVGADRYAGPTRREDLGRIFRRLDEADIPLGSQAT